MKLKYLVLSFSIFTFFSCNSGTEKTDTKKTNTEKAVKQETTKQETTKPQSQNKSEAETKLLTEGEKKQQLEMQKAAEAKSNSEETFEEKKARMTKEAHAEKFENLNVPQFKGKMNDKNVVILDVRTPQEVSKGSIKGATFLNVLKPDFDERMKKLNKNKTYLIYCATGRRSVNACLRMSNAGFKNLYNLEDGYSAWK